MKSKDVIASSAGYLDELMWMSGILGERNAFDNNMHTHCMALVNNIHYLVHLHKCLNITPSCMYST